MTAPRTLLTVSGVIPAGLDDDVAAGARPRVDYREMARAFGGDVASLGDVPARARSVLTRLRLERLVLAGRCVVRAARYDVIFTDGEHIGFPLAVLLRLRRRRRRPAHVMIGHVLSSPRKRQLHRWLRLRGCIDHVVVYSSAQARVLTGELGYSPEQVTLSPFMVDTAFFRPPDEPPSPNDRPRLAAAGLEARDYPTLIEAVRDLDVQVVLATGSQWSRRTSGIDRADLPANVEVVRLSYPDLRANYARCDVVVVPLRDVDFSAGITALLEGMAMAKPVVVSRATGQGDVVQDGTTGVYVPPGDPAAMREAIAALLADPVRAGAMGAAARTWAVQHADIEVYAGVMAEVVARAAGARRAR